MIQKFANYAILDEAPVELKPLSKAAHRADFKYEPREGYVYVRSRAISSRTNDNFDTFPGEELKLAWRTFIGKPVFVNHYNDDIKRKRGVIIDAALHEDTAPDGTEDTWIEVLMEVDAVRFPKLANAVVERDIERTSMGCDVVESECSYCGNVARTPNQYCAHVQRMKGQRLRRKNEKTGKMEDVLVHEICRGLSFFENSLLVEEPADPTAVTFGLDVRGIEMEGLNTMSKAATKTALNTDDPVEWAAYLAEQAGTGSVSRLSGNDLLALLEAAGSDDSYIRGQAERAGDSSVSRVSGTDVMKLVEMARTSKKTAASEWVIAGVDAGDVVFWSNESGWGGREGATVFSDTSVPLPFGQMVQWQPASVTADTIGSDFLDDARRMGLIAKKTAGDAGQRVPNQIDTLRTTECPVCGDESPQWDSDGRCSACGYLPAPKPFAEPDTDIAGRVDHDGGWFDPSLAEADPFEEPDEEDHAPNTVEGAASTYKGQRARTSSGGEAQMAQTQSSIAAAARRRHAARTDASRKQADTRNPAQPVPEPAAAGGMSLDEQRNIPTETNSDVTRSGGEIADPIQGGPADVKQIGGVAQDEIVAGTNQTDNVEVPVSGTTQVDPAAVIGVEPDHRAESFGDPAFSGDWMKPGQDTVPDIGGDATPGPDNSVEARRRAAARNSAQVRSMVGKQVAAARDRIYASLLLAQARKEAGEVSGDLVTIARKIEESSDSVEVMHREASVLKRQASRRPAPTARRQASRAPSLAGRDRPVVAASSGMGVHDTDAEMLFLD